MSDLATEQLVINAFNGAIKVRPVTTTGPDPDSEQLAFNLDVTFDLTNAHLIRLSSAQKPPMHFHPHQHEYIQVLDGALGVEVEHGTGKDKEYRLRPTDGRFVIRPWVNHRLYPLLDEPDDSSSSARGEGPFKKSTRFLLSGEATPDAFRLDTLFFTNWYGYQNEVVMTPGKGMDLLQVMNMFDAGGSYLTLPWWLPFRGSVSQLAGIVIGRWLGGLLGYQPFYRQWSHDWELACEKMETCLFYRRFADRTKTKTT